MADLDYDSRQLENELELRKIKLLAEVKTEVSEWGRFWLGTFVAVISLVYFALGIFGYLGFFQVVDSRLQIAIEEEVRKPAAKIHDQLSSLARGAQDQLNKTVLNTRLADRLLRESEERLKELSKESRDLELKVKDWLEQVEGFRTRFDGIQGKWSSMKSDVEREISGLKAFRVYLYDQSIDWNLNVVELDYRLKHLNQQLRFVRDMSSEVSYAETVQAVAEKFQEFDKRWIEANEHFAMFQRVLEERKRAKILYYTVGHNRKRADYVVGELRKKGFLAESWLTSSEDLNGAASEIAEEFKLSLRTLFSGGAQAKPIVIATERTERLLKDPSLAKWRAKEGLDIIVRSDDIDPQKQSHLVPVDRITKSDIALIVDLAVARLPKATAAQN